MLHPLREHAPARRGGRQRAGAPMVESGPGHPEPAAHLHQRRNLRRSGLGIDEFILRHYRAPARSMQWRYFLESSIRTQFLVLPLQLNQLGPLRARERNLGARDVVFLPGPSFSQLGSVSAPTSYESATDLIVFEVETTSSHSRSLDSWLNRRRDAGILHIPHFSSPRF